MKENSVIQVKLNNFFFFAAQAKQNVHITVNLSSIDNSL